MADPFTVRSLTRHHTYYIASADLSFLLDHVQFRVHRYFFERESAFFRGKLTLPMSPGSSRQGSSDSDPLVLEDVKPEDFERFLWVFYNPRYSLYDAQADDWSVILKLAHQWGFEEVKALSVRELEKKEFSHIDRIVVYQANNVDRNLLIPHFATICAREAPLTLSEGLRLGMETTVVIASAREYVRAKSASNGLRSPITPSVEGEELYDMIRELFNIPSVRKVENAAPTKDGLKKQPNFTKVATPAPAPALAPPLPPSPPPPPQLKAQPQPQSPLLPQQQQPPAPEPPLSPPKIPTPEIPQLQTELLSPTVPSKSLPPPPSPQTQVKEEPIPSPPPPPKEMVKAPPAIAVVIPPPFLPTAAAPSTDMQETPSTPTRAGLTPAQKKLIRKEKLRAAKKEREEMEAKSMVALQMVEESGRNQIDGLSEDAVGEDREEEKEDVGGVVVGGVKKGEEEYDVKDDGVKREMMKEVKQEEVKKNNDGKQEETKKDEEVKQEDKVKQQEVKEEEVTRSEAKDEVNGDEVKQEVKQDEVKQADVKQDEMKQEEGKQDEVKQENVDTTEGPAVEQKAVAKDPDLEVQHPSEEAKNLDLVADGPDLKTNEIEVDDGKTKETIDVATKEAASDDRGEANRAEKVELFGAAVELTQSKLEGQEVGNKPDLVEGEPHLAEAVAAEATTEDKSDEATKKSNKAARKKARKVAEQKAKAEQERQNELLKAGTGELAQGFLPDSKPKATDDMPLVDLVTPTSISPPPLPPGSTSPEISPHSLSHAQRPSLNNRLSSVSSPAPWPPAIPNGDKPQSPEYLNK